MYSDKKKTQNIRLARRENKRHKFIADCIKAKNIKSTERPKLNLFLAVHAVSFYGPVTTLNCPFTSPCLQPTVGRMDQ